MPFLLEKGQEMIVVPAVGQHFQDQGRVSDAAEHCRSKEGTVVAVGHPLPQNSKGATVSLFCRIFQVIQKSLNFGRGFQGPKDLILRFGQMLIELVFKIHFDPFIFPYPWSHL
jgi:hypothetical protein